MKMEKLCETEDKLGAVVVDYCSEMRGAFCRSEEGKGREELNFSICPGRNGPLGKGRGMVVG